MRRRPSFLIATVPVFLFSFGLQAQTASPTGNEPFERPVSLKKLVPNLLQDQRQIWTFPARILKDNNWVPVLGVTAATTGLVFADPAISRYFRRHNAFDGFNSALSGSRTELFTALVPISFYAVGLARNDTHAKKTALLAGEALADAEIVTTVFKTIADRARPQNLARNSSLSDTWFEGKRTSGSFPSGHSIAAFAIATVIARRYPHRRWVPYVAYGVAGIIGISRISLSAHFTSDVFMGAALGYSISRFSVLRQ